MVDDPINGALRRVQAIRWEQEPRLLLHGPIPEPLHGVNPRSIFGQQWWDETRRRAYLSTANHCKACGIWKPYAASRQWLEGHEVYEIDWLAGVATYMRTVPLCHYCHSYIHRGRLQAMLQEGKITHTKYTAIIQHGDEVLRLAGLEPFVWNANVGMAPWKQWRLIIGGKEYKPRPAPRKPRRKK
jgi:hypothetical protein